MQYGKPFVLLEDAQKSTFIYTGVQWVPHSQIDRRDIRVDCQVKELPQKIKGMTRYEICAAVRVGRLIAPTVVTASQGPATNRYRAAAISPPIIGNVAMRRSSNSRWCGAAAQGSRGRSHRWRSSSSAARQPRSTSG